MSMITYKLNDKIRGELEQIGGDRLPIMDNIDEHNFINNIFPEHCKGYNYVPSIIPAVDRIVVFGDIHGDYEYAKKLLTMSKVAKFENNNVEWIGGKTYVVQVGDQIDRCRPVGNMQCNNPLTTKNDEASDIKILKLFNKLNTQALKHGGAVISLLGNHEIINSLGQMNYVSYQGLEQFKNYVPPDNPNIVFKSGEDARSYAFAPGHEYGKLLGCSRSPAIIIGSNLFVHAGIVDGLIKEIDMRGMRDFEAINIAIRKWLIGLLDVNYVKDIIIGSRHSMFWTRILGSIPANVPLSNPVCDTNIGNVLKMFKIGSIIIGHTPQSFIHNENINGTCSNKVWRVDNGSSHAFGVFDTQMVKTGVASNNRRPQYLEIINDVEYKSVG